MHTEQMSSYKSNAILTIFIQLKMLLPVSSLTWLPEGKQINLANDLARRAVHLHSGQWFYKHHIANYWLAAHGQLQAKLSHVQRRIYHPESAPNDICPLILPVHIQENTDLNGPFCDTACKAEDAEGPNPPFKKSSFKATIKRASSLFVRLFSKARQAGNKMAIIILKPLLLSD